MKILYLEDRSYARKYIAMAFQAHPGLDYELVLAEDEDSFVRLMQSEKPDLALIDIDLGSGKTGLEVVRDYLKVHGDSRTYLVFLTELQDAGHYPLIAAARRLGAKGFLHKGMTDPDQLAEALRQVWEYPDRFYLLPELKEQLLLHLLDNSTAGSSLVEPVDLNEKEGKFLLWHAQGHSRQEVIDRLEQHFEEKITGHQHDRIKEDLWLRFRMAEQDDVEKEIKSLVAYAVAKGFIRPY